MVERIQQVVNALSAGGIRARRGYPEEKYFRPDSPVAAVYLEEARGESVTVAAQIFGGNASDCEDCADLAWTLLTALEGECTVESCCYERQMGLYSMRVLIRWDPGEDEQLEVETGTEPETEAEPSYTVALNGVQMPYVTAFSALFIGELYQSTETADASILYNAKVWALTVEELLPSEAALVADVEEPFTLSVARAGGTENYAQCRWDTIRRTETADGVRQVRVAKTWEDREVD